MKKILIIGLVVVMLVAFAGVTLAHPHGGPPGQAKERVHPLGGPPGQDPETNRPPGWDIGEKLGWVVEETAFIDEEAELEEGVYLYVGEYGNEYYVYIVEGEEGEEVLIYDAEGEVDGYFDEDDNLIVSFSVNIPPGLWKRLNR